MYKPIQNHICAASSHLHPALLQKAIVISGLTWGIPLAQYFAMQTWGLIDPVVIKTEVKDDSVISKLEKNNDTLLGLPLELDRELPNTVIQLRYKGAVLFEIQSLAVPVHFDN